jgi:hypothetical protein
MRRNALITGAILAAAVVCLTSNRGASQARVDQATSPSLLQTAAAIAAFGQIASVLQSPRCLNCHPRGNRPTQGEDRHVHLMNVQRGERDTGVPAMRCSTCHQERNNETLGIPGAPRWHLAPASMGWVGLGEADLCRRLLDRRSNGGRNTADLVAHMTGDPLVLHAWDPGGHRAPPPLSIEEFKIALDQWSGAGAPCPK